MYMNYILNQIGNRYVAYNQIDKNHYEIGYADYKILQYLKEGQSDQYICDQLLIDEDEFKKNKGQLFEMGFLSDLRFKKKQKIKWNKIYLFRLDTSKLKSNMLTIFLERTLIFMCMVSIIYFFILFFNSRINWENIFMFSNAKVLDVTVTFVVIQILTVIMHEFFHLVFAINRGVNVPEIGAMLYFLSPSGFSDLTQINFFEKKSSKIICLLAGLLFNFVLMSFSLSMLFFFDVLLFQTIFITNLVAIVVNLGFYIKLDGYYILQILLEENHLREKALLAIRKLSVKKTTENDIVYYIIGFCSHIYIPILLVNILMSLWRYFV